MALEATRYITNIISSCLSWSDMDVLHLKNSPERSNKDSDWMRLILSGITIQRTGNQEGGANRNNTELHSITEANI
jgi:hypothetical protein